MAVRTMKIYRSALHMKGMLPVDKGDHRLKNDSNKCDKMC